ncbi:MAG: DUF3341 domain-containing protein, partial [Alphaproteobacteria bacterium]|nr:DUF3341 domain-containing protein [Alphaproteobacteria bacterium]
SLGFVRVEAYSPYPVEGIGELIHPGRKAFLPLLMFAAAVAGACWGYFIQWWDEAWDYPLNVGGRPHNSWPAFTVGGFEFTALCAIAAGFFGFLAFCRLPRLYHPVLNAPEFERASVDRFLLCVEARDPSFEPQRIRRVFERSGAEHVSEVAE